MHPPPSNLNEIGAYIASDNPARALSFIDELEAKARLIAEQPLAFPSRDDLTEGLWCAVHGRGLLFFRDFASEVRIVRILHGARDLPRLMSR